MPASTCNPVENCLPTMALMAIPGIAAWSAGVDATMTESPIAVTDRPETRTSAGSACPEAVRPNAPRAPATALGSVPAAPVPATCASPLAGAPPPDLISMIPVRTAVTMATVVTLPLQLRIHVPGADRVARDRLCSPICRPNGVLIGPGYPVATASPAGTNDRRTCRCGLSRFRSTTAIDCQVPSASDPPITGSTANGGTNAGSTCDLPWPSDP